MNLNNQVVLVTGGTGSFGKKFVQVVTEECTPRKLIIFSRDEFKQHEMRTQGLDHPNIRYFLGDVRDKDRLYRALDGVDIVIHAAALKQVPSCEYNPIEAVKTNVVGAANLIDAAIDQNVGKVLAVSTDKAVNPINLYGATKLCAEKLFVAGNNYSGPHCARFSVVRYGNVLGSRGSVISVFRKLRETGVLPVTDPLMTRFWLTLEQAAKFVLASLEVMEGGEIFVPKVGAMNIVDLVRAIAPECSTRTVGIRPGEKLHEILISEDDARNTLEHDNHFVILPAFHEKFFEQYLQKNGGKPCPRGFSYSSNANTQRLQVDDLRRVLKEDEQSAYEEDGE